MPTRRRIVDLVTILAFLLVFGADFLFFRHPIGWTLAPYAYFLLLGSLAIHRRGLDAKERILLGVPIFIVASSFWLDPKPLAVFLCVVGLACIPETARSSWTTRLDEWIARWLNFSIAGWAQIWVDQWAVLRWGFRTGGYPRRGAALLRLWLLPVSFSSVFLLLFAFANPIIEARLDGIFTLIGDVLNWLTSLLEAPRILFWILSATWIWAVLRYRKKNIVRLPSPDVMSRWVDRLTARESAHATPIILRCLLLFNLVFLVQTVMDIRYLWGLAELPEGMSYAEYAHRGAYPLVATTLLAALFVLAAIRPENRTQEGRWIRRLVYFWLSQNVLLAISSIWRMGLYVEAYSLTRLRVYTGLWLLLVVFGLLSILWRILRNHSPQWLVEVNASATIVLLIACCFMNVPRFIANYNVKHCREITGEGPVLDVRYLARLGYEAIPAFDLLISKTTDEEIANRYGNMKVALQNKLGRRTQEWRGWTIRRARLAREYIEKEAIPAA